LHVFLEPYLIKSSYGFKKWNFSYIRKLGKKKHEKEKEKETLTRHQ
jgi:hypothetical protein